MKENTYTLFWKDGNSDVIIGASLQNAMALSGFVLTDKVNLFFHKDDDVEDNYTYDDESGEWNINE